MNTKEKIDEFFERNGLRKNNDGNWVAWGPPKNTEGYGTTLHYDATPALNFLKELADEDSPV